MKKFLLKLAFLSLFAALGFLGWRTAELLRDNRQLRETVIQLERERRELRQQQAKAQPPVKPEQQAGLRAQLERDTSQLRGLQFKGPVNYRMIARAGLRDLLLRKAREQYTEQELHDYGRTLATLGLVPEGTDLLQVILGLYDEQVAAFYVPEERTLYTFEDLSWTSGLDKMLLCHEITHALQDQNFDLTTFPLKHKENDDLVLATAALIEGDATVLMTRWYADHIDPGAVFNDLGAIFRQSTAKLLDAPLYLREMLLFPYLHGQHFAMALFEAGGTQALNEAFRNPPTSTTEILHPEKYLGGWKAASPIDLPRLQSSQWRLIGNNVLGEFGIRCLLQEAQTVFQAQWAARGWAGDRYHVYERATNGPTALVWDSHWESEQDAEEFMQAYNSLLQKRGPAAVASARVRRDGARVQIRQCREPAFFELLEAAHAR